MEFRDGAAGVVRGSWTAGGPAEQITMTVYGEHAMVSLDTSVSESEFTFHSAEGAEKIKADTVSMTGLYESFLTAVKGEGAAVSDFNQALKIQYYIEQSLLSAEGGLRLHIDAPAE